MGNWKIVNTKTELDEGKSFRHYAKYDPSKFCDDLRNVDWNVNEYSHVIIYTKKLLNSDWLRNECSSSVTRVQTCNTNANW